MGLFDRNPNESAFVGGKKHWTDVIKNSGPGTLLIWRQPEEDFNTNSTLIVMPGEQAIFIKGGNIEQTFESGTYKLDTNNYPFISRLRNAFSGGVSTFNAVVYFVRTAHSMEIRWGTVSPIQVRDPVIGMATTMKARGAYKVTISNPGLFLEKMIGNNVQFETQDGLQDYFAEEFQSKIKSTIARAVQESHQEILGIDSRLDELSDRTKPLINEIMADYGLKCVTFTISAIDIDADELRRKYDEINLGAYGEVTMQRAQATGQMEALNIQGDNYGKIQATQILRDLANNPGAGGAAAAGAGIGMGMGAANVFGQMANQVFAPVANNQQNYQQNPMNQGADARFAQQGAYQQQNSFQQAPVQQAPAVDAQKEEIKAKLASLKEFYAEGLISEADYNKKKADLLEKLL